jgi:oligoendopeptidase F
MRSAEVEEVLGMLQEPFQLVEQTATELENSDIKFADAVDSHGKRHPVLQSLLDINATSTDRKLRQTAWESFCDGYRQMINTFANNYITHVKQQVFLARVRGYSSVLQAHLDPFKVSPDVFHNLLDTFRANLPTWHKYWDVKRRVLKYDTFYPYDIWAPLGENPPQIDYPQTVDWICEGMAPLGAKFVSILRTGCLEESWVDWVPNSSKQQGAFSMPQYDMPPYIMMSYTNDISSLSTLAHELGHSMHSYYTDTNQPEIYNGYNLSMTLAETASNLNQALVRAYLREIKADDSEFQLAIIEEAIANYHRYLFQMLNLSRFELEVYTRAEQDKPLSAQILLDLMQEIYAEGYGETMTDDPARTSTTWAQFSHLYMPYYTFQYAVGISAADAIAHKIKNEGQPAAENYLKFLSTGSSQYTMRQFEIAGVDMTSHKPVQKAFNVLAGLVSQLEELI